MAPSGKMTVDSVKRSVEGALHGLSNELLTAFEAATHDKKTWDHARADTAAYLRSRKVHVPAGLEIEFEEQHSHTASRTPPGQARQCCFKIKQTTGEVIMYLCWPKDLA